MKRVIFVETSEDGGGSSESMIQTITRLDRTRFAPYVLFVNDLSDTKYVRRLREMDVPVFTCHNAVYTKTSRYRQLYVRLLKYAANIPFAYLPLYRYLHRTSIRALTQIIREHNIDIIHLNISIARDLFGVMVAHKLHVPCVSHIRSAKMLSFPAAAQQFANAHTERFITISDFIQDLWIDLGLERGKCITIHNGIDQLPTTKRAYTSIPQKADLTFCTVGRLVAWKNHAWLLASFAAFCKTHPNAQLIILGEGPERPRLERLIAHYDLSQHVTLTGNVDDPTTYLNASDIFVFPSRKEPFGRAVLEAMSLGMPLIAANSGGIPEFVTDKKSGLLVPLNDVEALTQAMETLATDGELAKRLGEAAQKAAGTQFTSVATTHRVMDVYDSITTA